MRQDRPPLLRSPGYPLDRTPPDPARLRDERSALDRALRRPLRLHVETLLGFKMVKWLRAIEFVEDYRGLRDGQGGSREDIMYYEQSISI